jgi:hypothetical protein
VDALYFIDSSFARWAPFRPAREFQAVMWFIMDIPPHFLLAFRCSASSIRSSSVLCSS